MFALRPHLKKKNLYKTVYILNQTDFLPVEHPDEFESESVHSTGNGRENKVQSCLSKDLTWYDKWLFIPLVSDNEVRALVTLALSDSENQTGGVDGYVSWRRGENNFLKKINNKKIILSHGQVLSNEI